ncbi:peroxide stress protein YaaA [Candidatus Marinimicrobia bacterium]|jgi:hypothetical protein|nr:peroxide stress protein YaaA [Candidatus Neomarinimicrobiota bacterium]
MITVLSPAKKLSKECFSQTGSSRKPQFLDRSENLVNSLKKLDPVDYMGLMNISDSLAMLNWERMQKWNSNFNKKNSREAIYSFAGDTYSGFDALTLNNKDIKFADSNIRILSGLYGLLRPLDLIMPYRLEMGTKFSNEIGSNLYAYWDSLIASSIHNDLKNHNSKYIINCASLEYFKSVNLKKNKLNVITPQFKDWKNGKLKIISFYAKKARGMMARYIVTNKIENEADILKFNLGGYKFEPALSNPSEPVFTRNQA